MKRFVVFGLLAGGMLTTVLVSSGLADTAKSEQMVVATPNAPLMRGSSTLATLPAGQRFDVLRTQGNWIGARTTVNGRTVNGWLWRGQVTTPQQFAARPQAAGRYSYQPGMAVRRYSYAPAVPGAATPYRGPYPYATNTLPPDMRDYVTGGLRSGSPLIMGATRYGPSYWRADRKIIGY